MIEGVVVKGYSGYYYVKHKSLVWECSLRGKFRLDKKPALAGDKVLFRENGRGKGVIEEILPRTSELERPPIANVEAVVVVMALKDPNLNRQLLDRMLIQAEQAGLNICVCINKIDLGDPLAAEQIKDVYSKAGYHTVLVSSKFGLGIEELRNFLIDKISVIAGPSGAGKSSLLNTVQPGLCLKTGEVSEKIGRGKHTTRHVELLELEVGGFVADTPGFSSLYLPPLTKEELVFYFPEFEPYENRCKFSGCLHRAEPQCAVKNAVNKGEIDQERYNSYLAFIEELASNERRY